MQARLQVNRFPRFFAIVLFALTAAVVLGGALGYTIRASVAGPGPSHAIVQQGTNGASTVNANNSAWGESHKPY